MEKGKEKLKKAIGEFMEIYEKNQNKNLLTTYYSLQNWQLPEVSNPETDGENVKFNWRRT